VHGVFWKNIEKMELLWNYNHSILYIIWYKFHNYKIGSGIIASPPEQGEMVMIFTFHSEALWKARRIRNFTWRSSTSRRDSQGVPCNFVNGSPRFQSRGSLWARTSRDPGHKKEGKR
jgi:hypothetical protein